MAGIYIHIPFCKQACTYCDFHFSTTFEKYRDEMIKAIVKEIEVRKEYIPEELIETIYFGGGTPSILTSSEIELILNSIELIFVVAKDAEVTLEANPDDITEEKLFAWKSVGVNRLSIGVQSFRQQDLDWMNRAHSVSEAENALNLATKLDFKLTLDLIYGLPNFSLVEFKQNIDKALACNPEHISAYCLTVEEKTALHKAVKENRINPSSNEEQEEQFNFLVEYLSNAGFEQYEISNFARNKEYAKHNSNYWLGKAYLGVGPSAHSFDGTNRAWNISNNTQYIKRVNSAINFTEIEELTQLEKFNETILIGLRTMWGVNISRLNKALYYNQELQSKIAELKAKNWLVEKEQHLILTQEGKLFADAIAAELFLVE